jgi:hypothetical protein
MLVGLSIFGRKKKERKRQGKKNKASPVSSSLRRVANELRGKKRKKGLLRIGGWKDTLIKRHTRKVKKITNQF